MWKNTVRLLMAATLVVSFSLLTGGCAKKTVKPEEGVKPAETTMEAPKAEEKTYEATGEGMGPVESLASEPIETAPALSQPESLTISEGRTNAPLLPIYFDFDKSNIRPDQSPRLEQNAGYLKGHPSVVVRIEGNCDERGTSEYNMALGERRAQNAKKYLLNLGVNRELIKTISYGEEKPLLHGHDELSWAQNRRDDFVIVDR